MGEARPLPQGESRRPAARLLGTRLFTISYVPLWAIFAVRSSALPGRVVFTLLAVWGLVDAFRIISAGLRRSSRTIAFDDISDKSADVSGYLATYLLPFIAGPPTDFGGWVAYAIYFLVAWAVFVPSRLGLVNPTLYVMGWQVVEATRNGHREIIIAQDPPRSGAASMMVGQFSGSLGWVQRPTRRPWTWASRRDRPR